MKKKEQRRRCWYVSGLSDLTTNLRGLRRPQIGRITRPPGGGDLGRLETLLNLGVH